LRATFQSFIKLFGICRLSADYFQSLLANNGGHRFVATSNGILIGKLQFISVQICQWQNSPQTEK